MRRVLFAAALVLSMTLAGCFGPSTASWGNDSGEIDVQFTQESATVTSELGSETEKIADIQPVGCLSDGSNKTLSTAEDAQDSQSIGTVSFTGYLAVSHFYSSHSELAGAKGLDMGVTTSVAIERMSFDMAENVVDGEGSRIDVKNWDQPLMPETGAGSVDLDEIDQDSESSWYILGLIPTSENIQYGLTSLDEWHQAVTIDGYLVEKISSGNTQGYYNDYQTVDEDCSLAIGSNNNERIYVLVTRIVLDGATISSNGDSDEEWVHGDVAFVGRTGYILFFLAFGVGGGLGAFILSKMFVLQGAKSTMRTLLGKSGMDSIKKVKEDVKAAKSAGLISPTERKKEAQKQASKDKPQESKDKSSEPALAGFDLDSVLSSGPSTGSTNEFGGRESSVVETIESQEMEQEITDQSSVIPGPTMHSSIPPRQTRSSVTSNNPPTQQREHFTSSAPSSKKSSAPTKKKSVRKRKTAPVQEEQVWEETQPEPQKETRKSFDEPEEDFSDFSF